MNANDGITRFYCQCEPGSCYENGICTTCGGIEQVSSQEEQIRILEREISRLQLEGRIQSEKYSDLLGAYRNAIDIIREQSESVGRLIMMVDRP